MIYLMIWIIAMIIMSIIIIYSYIYIYICYTYSNQQVYSVCDYVYALAPAIQNFWDFNGPKKKALPINKKVMKEFQV